MFDNRLKTAREQRGETQQQVAKNLGLPYTTYRNYELNLREPSIETLRAIARYFDLSLNYLLGYDEGQPPPIQDVTTKQILKYLAEFSDKEKRKVKDYCDYINYLRNKAD